MRTNGKIRATDAMHSVTLHIAVVGVRELRVRLWIGLRLLRLAAWIMNCRINVVSEDKPNERA